MSKDNAQIAGTLPPAAPRRRGMLILLALALFFGISIVILIQNANPVSQFLIKQFAARYDIDILELNDDNSSLDTIRLARLKLNYQGNQLELNNLKLEFVDALAIIKRQQFLSSDLKRISVGDATLSLSPDVVKQLLIGSEQTQDSLTLKEALSLEQIKAWQQALSLTKNDQFIKVLPEINLGNIKLEFPDFSSDPVSANIPGAQKDPVQQQHLGENPMIVTLPEVSFNRKGELSTEFRVNSHPIITIKAKVDPSALAAPWQLDTELSIRSAHQGLIEIAAYLDKSRAALALKPSQIQSQINQMIAAVGKVSAKGVDIDGRWLTHSTLSMQDLRFTSQQSLPGLTLKLSPHDISQDALKASSADEARVINIAPTQPLSAEISLNTQTLSAKVSPLQLSLSLNAEQRQLIAASLFAQNPQSLLANTLEPWLARLSTNLTNVHDANTQGSSTISHISLALETTELMLPTTALLSMINGAAIPVIPSDRITVTLPGARAVLALGPHTSHQQQIELSQYQLAYFPLTKNSVQQFNVKWQLSQKMPVAFMPTPLANINIEQGTLLLEGHAKLEHSFATLATHKAQTNNPATHNPATQFSFILAPSSLLTLDGVSAALGDSHLQAAKLQLEQVDQGAHTEPLQSTMFEQGKLTLADMSLQLKQPQLTLRQPSKAAESVAKAANLSLKLKGMSPLEASLGTAISSQVAWQFAKLDVRRTNPSKGEKNSVALLVLDSLSLEQRLKLNKGILSSHDKWLLDSIPMHSQHWLQAPWLTPPSLNGTAASSTITDKTTHASTSLAGLWQFELDLTQALSVAAKTQSLPKNSFIQGTGTFNGSYLLQQVNDGKEQLQRFEFRFEPEFEHLSGDYLDYNFSDASFSAKCQLDWQQIQGARYSKSLLNCTDTKLAATEANLGLRLNQLKLQSDIQLTQDDSKTANNWLQLVTGLSHTEVNLTASGDILDGHFLIPEFSLRVQDSSKGHILLQGLSLEALLAAQPQVGVAANGIFDGVLPAQFTDGKLQISGGQLAARAPGGRIQVSGNPAIDDLTQMQPHLALVFTALEDLNYHQLSSSFDMTRNGDASLNVKIKGNSVGIERPIHLNYSHEENLLQLYRSLMLPTQLQDTIEQSIK